VTNRGVTERRYRVLAVGAHPVQYMSPIFRRMAQHPQLDLKVAYCSLRGAEAGHDPEFNATVRWDVPLLDGYDWIEVVNRGSGSESFFGLYNPGLWKLIREGKFDAILCYTGYLRASFWIALAAARASGSAMIFGTDASSLAPRDARGWKIPIKKIVWPRLFGMADQVIVCSRAGVEMMHSLGLSDDRVTLTPFVVDNDWWSARSSSVDRLAVRATWDVTPGQAVVFFCAKLQPWKRPLDLLRAFAKADAADSVLVFAGEGPLRPQLESEAQRLGIASRVRFLGFTNQTQLPAVYCASDLFVLPSDYDPCPVVVCEAMLCGLPVLLSDEIRGRFDLVRSGVTGEIFRCGDVDALASAISLLLRDRDLLTALGKNARIRMDTWTPKDNISATVDAISVALQRRHGSDPRASGEVPGSSISTSARNAKT
jgi:glycosyltransferase involved in cell wall biosynthesis